MEKVIKDKDSEIENLKNQLAFLKGQILNKNRKFFGQSSEQESGDQLSFFNEAEKDSDSKISEPDIETVTYSRKKSVSHNGKKDNTANLKRVVIEHKLDDSKKVCDKCGNQLSLYRNTEKGIIKIQASRNLYRRTYNRSVSMQKLRSGS